jgi:two-component system sensor histidine kinase HydH
MLNKHPKGSHIYIIAILFVVTVITMLSSIAAYTNALNAANDSLKLQSLGIAVSLEASLSKIASFKDNIFKEIITEGKWEGIAFIALYDKDGMTLLHSNENLIGRQVKENSIIEAADAHRPVYERMTLGTGEEVFVLNFPAHIHRSEKILRLALHTYPVQRIIAQARVQLISIGSAISILWLVGYFLIKALKRSDALKKEIAEKERLAMIGEMASALAHEIRNPLGSIKGFAQYLSERSETKDEMLDVIISESKRLERLTDDLLVYAKPIEVRVEEFSLDKLIAGVVKSCSLSNSGGIDLKISAPQDMKIVSDKDKLRQIITNIVQNAIDSISGKGTVEIKAEHSNGNALISVSDTGCGMDKDSQEKAFKPFFTTKTKGTGLGLAIVDKLAAAIGGRIEIETEYQKGTLIKIIIPKNLI